MSISTVTQHLSVAPQLSPTDIPAIRDMGFKSIICNRPDGEGADQPTFAEIQHEAEKHGMLCQYQPIVSGKVLRGDAAAFGEAIQTMPGPTLAYCRTGTRSITLWAMSAAASLGYEEILRLSQRAGYDIGGVVRRLKNGDATPTDRADYAHAVVIVGAGAAGVAVASSLRARCPDLDVAIIEPNDVHYYQPGWTLVGGGVFNPNTTVRTTSSVIPDGVKWIKAGAAAFLPKDNLVVIDGCRTVKYQQLVVCPGIKLDWDSIEGLPETLGENGVTSNYRFDLAPYTWEVVKNLKGGKALFTQPPMPIKCAGAPQKALYMSCDHWLRAGILNAMNVQFYTPGEVLFGVKEYVPALMEYIEKYHATLNFGHQLVAVDGPNKRATFRIVNNDDAALIETGFDMLHVVPPQAPPDFIKVSPLADASGWIDVDPSTLQHKEFENVFGLGDAMNAPNAKTAAAARIQAPVVATNVLCARGMVASNAIYNGYGSCPLTVERGKVILAEFGYGGKILPSMPTWLINGQRPSRLAWYLKEKILPPVYWQGMLKGREWLAKPATSKTPKKPA